jgi:hypothetical protein
MKPSHYGKRNAKLTTLRWGCLLVMVLACSTILLGLTFLGRQHGPNTASASAPQAPLYQSLGDVAISSSIAAYQMGLALYPYSVIPGGVETAQDLRRAVAADPIVAQHYAGFDLARAQLIHLHGAREAYVSYRIGDRIYWTKRKLKLAAGEGLLTDGTREARTRCGNRVSYVPQAPVSPVEPPEESFEIALPPVVIEIPPPDLSFNSDSPLIPPGLDTSLPFSPPGAGGGFPPFGTPIVGGGGGSSPPWVPPTGGEGVIPPTTPPISTPEPNSAMLLVVGLGALYSSLLLKRRVTI